jgi:hypothetical protein
MEGREERVNGLGIKDEYTELKATPSLPTFTFVPFHWTSFFE